jgi:hypothetical protein
LRTGTQILDKPFATKSYIPSSPTDFHSRSRFIAFSEFGIGTKDKILAQNLKNVPEQGLLQTDWKFFAKESATSGDIHKTSPSMSRSIKSVSFSLHSAICNIAKREI